MKKINVLPQTFYQFECDKELIVKILPFIEKEDYVKTDQNLSYNAPTATSRSTNTTLHKEEKYIELIDWIYKCINEFKEDLQLQCEKFTITQCWSNSAGYGQSHHQHLHPNSFLSGILYLNNSDAKTLFAGENIWHYFNKKDKVMQIAPDFNPELNIIHQETSVAGKLILFPSSIIHLVEPHNSFTPNRYTISFNAFPSGKIGNMNFLTGLDIDIK